VSSFVTDIPARRRAALVLTIVVACFALLACNGDDDNGDASPTPVVTTEVSPTVEPGDGTITIDEPAEGATVTVPIAISGEANVFEGALIVEALDSSGRSICRRPVQATSGTGTPGTWSTVIAFAPPAQGGTLTLRAFSLSAQDGSEENVVTRQVEIAADRPRIVIEQPGCGFEADAGSMLAVAGTAAVFEATLQLELVDAGGNAVRQQTEMTASGIEDSPWSAAVDLGGLDPGPYTLIAFEFSAEDGSRQHDFPVPITVIP
jgi:hypothetical protein